MKTGRGKISILFVPEDEGESRSFRLSRTLFKAMTIAGIILGIIIASAGVSYYFLVKKVVTFDKLAAENKRLISENQRIYKLSQDLEQLKSMDKRLRRALGAKVEPSGKADTMVFETPEIVFDQAESVTGHYETIFKSPLEGMISRGYQAEIFPGSSHRGMDITAAEGSIVYAAADGWALFSGWHPRWGMFLIIQHLGDYSTFYGHLSVVLVETGERVTAGSPIALSGNTGRSTAPHLHFEIRFRGVSLDPRDFLAGVEAASYTQMESDTSASAEEFEADDMENIKEE